MTAYIPVNQRPRDTSQLDTEVDYAIRLAHHYLDQIKRFDLPIERIRILELGPGINLGPQLILSSYGAQVTVADRYLAPWSDDYHPEFYRRLRARWPGKSEALTYVVANNRYGSDVITTLCEPAERLASIPTGTLDCVFSHAVLEHVYNLPAVCRELARVTKLGGVNSHQIDFRHHLDFSKPLEFLLLSEREFRKGFVEKCGEQGNRWRPSEAQSLFELAGFELLQTVPTEQADQSYLRAFIPRLRGSRSRYRSWPADDLNIVSARLELKRVRKPTMRGRAALRFTRGEFRKLLTGTCICLQHQISLLDIAYVLRNHLRTRFRAQLERFTPEAGYCWVTPVAEHLPSDKDGISVLQLFENGKRLGPGHASHADIRAIGKGLYSHWGSVIYFSTSDNTDPRSNGRRYIVVEHRSTYDYPPHSLTAA